MNTLIDMNGRWPVALNVLMRVKPRLGPPETWRFRFEPCRPDRAVRVGSWAPDEDEATWQRIDWHRLPGRMLYDVALGVLAMRLFGAIEPVPRIVGAPLWHEVSAELTPETTFASPLSWELRACGDFSATLRVRQRAGERAVCRTVSLERVDADPLLALLRQAHCHVRPDAVRPEPHTPVPRLERAAPTHTANHAVMASL